MLPTDADFDSVKTPVMKWADLPLGKYIIRGKKTLKANKFGPAMIVKLQPLEASKDQTIQVWAPASLIRQLSENPETAYLRNNGLKPSAKNEGRKYYSFDLLSASF